MVKHWIVTVLCILAACAFGTGIFFELGQQKALEFFTGYLIEYALSVDNLFVFAVLFAFFKVSEKDQSRLLYWGIFGAIILRGLFILAGTTMITQFSWLLYLFGGFLIYTGFKLGFGKDDDATEPDKTFIYRLANRLNLAPTIVLLIIIEFTDLMFALDSVPAIFAITTDPFIVFSSNIFAILGLRSLYFVVRELIKKFHYLKVALSIILVFIGFKMVASYFFHIMIAFSLVVVLSVLAVAVAASIIKEKLSGRTA